MVWTVGAPLADHEGANPRATRGFTRWSIRRSPASIGSMTGPPASARPIGAQTVLVVDDHEGFRLRSRRLLERHGYRVVEAGDGATAIRQADRERPDIVLLDVHLPDIDGFEVATSLRASGTDATILLISTHPEADLAERLHGSAANGYLDKADLSAVTLAAKLASLA